MYSSLGAINTSSLYESVDAGLQARLGTFLGLKNRILAIKNGTKDRMLYNQADEVYADQNAAEAQVKDALTAADKMRTNGFDFASSAKVAVGVTAMERQIAGVKEIETAYLKEKGITTFDWQYWGKMLLFSGVGWWVFKKVF